MWVKSGSEALLKYALREETSENISEAEISGNGSMATYDWRITPFVITSDMIGKEGEGGLTLKLPEWAMKLTEGEGARLQYRQTVYGSESSTEELSGAEGFAFEAGMTYYISLSLGGADANNFVFDNGTQTSERMEYAAPQSFFGNVLGFLGANWIWFVIGLGALLLLILLIILLKRHKKKKAERLKAEAEAREKEEAKREKKEREEEERRRREEREEREERRMERMSMQQPMMMPMQQQPMQQPQPQPQPQAQAQPQPQPQIGRAHV